MTTYNSNDELKTLSDKDLKAALNLADLNYNAVTPEAQKDLAARIEAIEREQRRRRVNKLTRGTGIPELTTEQLDERDASRDFQIGDEVEYFDADAGTTHAGLVLSAPAIEQGNGWSETRVLVGWSDGARSTWMRVSRLLAK